MSPSGLVVTTELALRLVLPEGGLPLDAVLAYQADDPYAVHLSFAVGSGADSVVTWSFARSLLTAGVRQAVGEGDVRIWPGDAAAGERVVAIALSSPSGRALFEARLTDVVEFLTATYAAVPTGTEAAHLDLDAAIGALLAG